MGEKLKQDESGETAYVGFFATIEENTTEELIDTITNKLPKNTKTLYLLFCTGGGSVSHGFVIYNFLRALPYKVIIHNIGGVDSIGVTIFMAGQERYSCEHGTFLIHRVRSSPQEEKIETSYLKEKLSIIESDEKKIGNVITGNTKITFEEFKSLFNTGEVKGTEYALEKEMIHGIRPIPEIRSGVLVVKGGKSADGGGN